MLKLSAAKKNMKYLIDAVDADENLRSRFAKLGFLPGQIVELKRKAPIFGNPLLFEVEDGQYALTKHEASHIQVSEMGTE